jgi:putative effector of murein hydrolase
LLECGIFIWGFKLFECRRQLFSSAGALAIVISIVAAVGNVFLSVLAGRAMGLERPEALAFAARCATLALAKPAIEAVGGNMVVNAALVVGNGIFGQLMYPFALNLLCVRSDDEVVADISVRSETTNLDSEKRAGANDSSAGEVSVGRDDASTVASGIAIGINGAAMGVAYLYETRSRAAPYAALSMTVFGVVTVILTTVGPFKTLVISLAGA